MLLCPLLSNILLGWQSCYMVQRSLLATLVDEMRNMRCFYQFIHLTTCPVFSRRITTVNKWMLLNGYDVDKIWADIDDVIIKTMISAHPIIKHNYRTCFPNHVRGSACFEILGFDIVLDRKLKPYLLEVCTTCQIQET